MTDLQKARALYASIEQRLQRPGLLPVEREWYLSELEYARLTMQRYSLEDDA